MSYLRSFILNFLIVFFVDRISPGVEIVYYESVPDIGSDIIFSLIVGFLNASIYPLYVGLDVNVTKFKLAILSFIISYASFIMIALVPFGVSANAVGVLVGGTLVWIMAYFTNYLEWQHNIKRE